MKKTLIYMFLAFVVANFFTACETKEKNILNHKRVFLDDKYTDFIVKSRDDNKYLDASRFVVKNKKKYVRWSAHIVSINKDENQLVLREDELPKIDVKFEYKSYNVHSLKEGQLITFSGHPNHFSCDSTGTMCWDIRNGRIEEIKDEDRKNLDRFYTKQKYYEKEQLKKLLEEEKKEEEETKIEKKKMDEEKRYVLIGECLCAGTKLYMKNGDKMQLIAKILDVNNEYTDDKGYTYRAVKIQEYGTGDVYWKDKNKMIISGAWFIKKKK